MTETNKLTREELEAYRERWRAVNQFQTDEMRRASLELKLRQTNLLFRLALGMRRRDAMGDPELALVRSRWVKLKTTRL